MDTNRFGSMLARQQPRLKTTVIAASIALMLAQTADQARADSGTGQDTSIGNALNTAPINPVHYGSPTDPEGLGGGYDPVAHTPSGQMYLLPGTPNEPAKTAGGWEYRGHVEAGALNVQGNRDAYGFERYKDVDNGLYLNNFGVSLENPEAAAYFEVTGGGVGHDDQFYNFQFGHYNDWRVRGFYNETRHIFTGQYRSLYDGVGSGRLTLSKTGLANGLRPGGIRTPALDGVGANTAQTQDQYVAAGNAALAATQPGSLGITRQKGGIRADLTLTEQWKAFASFTSEKREGARPFGATLGGGGTNANVEIAEPIDYRTHDLLAGLQYADSLNAFNVQIAASWFRNNIDTLTFDSISPGVTAANGVTVANGGFPLGRFDLYPDNDYYNAKAEYARRLPEFYNGRFTAVVSTATSRQDDDLVPFSINPVSVGGLSNWNTTDSLSRHSADARIDTRLVDLGLALTPVEKLNVKGKLRYYETKNHTKFLLCNSGAGGAAANTGTAYGCTGVWGRVNNDGTGFLLGSNTVGNANIRNIPFDYKQTIYGLDADYRLSRANNINAAYEREIYDRDHREREKVWEDKYKFGYVNRALENGTIRASIEHDRKRGDDYETHHPYQAFYSGAIWDPSTAVGTNLTSFVVHMNSRLRKFDLADRDQNILNARLNYMLRPDLDLGLSAQFKGAKFPDSEYGRKDRQYQHSLNIDLNYQPNATTSLYAFYSRQQSKMEQQGVPSGAAAGFNCNIGNNGLTLENAEFLCADPNTGRVFDVANFWTATHRDTGDTFGIGLKQAIYDMTLDINYIFSLGKTKIDYSQPANLAANIAAVAGDGFETLKTTQHILEMNLLKPLSKNVALRLLYRYENGKIDDWHYYGLSGAIPTGGSPGAGIYMDAGPQDYHVHLFGILFNVSM